MTAVLATIVFVSLLLAGLSAAVIVAVVLMQGLVALALAGHRLWDWWRAPSPVDPATAARIRRASRTTQHRALLHLAAHGRLDAGPPFHWGPGE